MQKTNRGNIREGGQTLILFTLMICTLLLAVMSVVDVGFFLHNRENAQQAADAAALAGAQDLPENPSQASITALQYITKNGLNTANTTISFTCTSQISQICMPGDGRYDTIVVNQKAPSPTYFGGALKVLGFNNCWVTGCTAQATAAGCRGACGPIGTGPADIMVVLDHSYSMSTSDLNNATDATTTMFTDFDYNYQRVGLAVTPPVENGDHCDAIDSWTETPKIWMPAPLTTGFQSAAHVLNTNSPPVRVANCIDRTSWSFFGGELIDYPMCSCHTDVGSAIQAASNELIANGRADVTWGMVIVTDGASNAAPTSVTTTNSSNTTTSTATGTAPASGYYNCGAQVKIGTASSPTNPAGDNNGYEGTPANSCNSDNNYATDANSGTSSSQVSCPNTTGTSANPNGGAGANGKDKHMFYNYGISIPSGSTNTSGGVTTTTSVAVAGIEVRLEGKISSTSDSTRKFCVQLSADGGVTYTNAKELTITSTNDANYTFGGATDLWGYSSWSATQLNNTNFRIRVTNVNNNTTRTFSIDAIQTKVHYVTTTDTTTVTSTSTTDFLGSLGPCDWAMQQATIAKAAGIEIYAIGFGISSSERCYDFAEKPSSPYYSYTASQFLTAIATDSAHFYSEPKSEDLEPIFNAIGSQLTGGSRLVPCAGC